jgi:hypothetical protein
VLDPGWDMSELLNLKEAVSLQEDLTAVMIIIGG